ncbi:hypothetical protein IHV25_03795 [Phaeovibrio sulfidiphilus]|uniref:PepSY domain-containing protein n=1 Tax=Phaeovibrio sulfidiphilus TaxID=1220600 RepID=A0A8J6YNT2_9PROT|nr:PepSY domain-containing protein [Phaeovibrio sulfidiphilus]MBE1236776.1 hypothetical protein [Phaeovibrio sulfidiphilus]
MVFSRIILVAGLAGVIALTLPAPASAQPEGSPPYGGPRGHGAWKGGRCADDAGECRGRGSGYGARRLLRHSDHDRARRAVRSGEAVPLSWILTDIERTTRGRFLEATLDDEHGVLVYSVEILRSDGTVSKFIYDAKSGALLRRLDAGD